MANRVFDFARGVVTTASTLFGKPWGIARPKDGPKPDDGTGTAPLAGPPRRDSVGPTPPYTPPFQLRDDLPPEASRRQQEEEYAAAQVGRAAYYRSLPPWIDDLTRGLGDDLYARMGLDDQVFTSTRNAVRQVLADGMTIRPAIDDKDDPLFDQASDYAQRAERMLGELSAGLPQSMDSILQEAMLISAGMGHKVFELVYEPGQDGWTNLARIKSKPRRSTAFVVNPYNDLVGVLARLPGMALPALASVTDLRSMPILPVDKFAVLTHMQEDADPRGNSLWRAAYAQWWEKLQTAREYMKYLGQFAMPSLAGEMPETATDEPATDQFGNVQPTTPVSSAQAFVNQLVAFRNGSAIAHPHGAKIYTLFTGSTGEAFWHKLDRCDRQIDKVITGQVLAGQEAEHGTRAQSQTHQDTAGTNLAYYRGLLEEMLNKQILRRWMRLNVDGEEARTLCPTATLRKVEEQDRGEMMTCYSTGYKAGLVKPSQLPFVHEQLGLPPCEPDELTSPTDDAMKLAQAKGPAGGDGAGGKGKGGAEFADDDSGGHWRTINGAHVFIGKDGKIEKGPAHLVGKPADEGNAKQAGGSSGAKKPKPEHPPAGHPPKGDEAHSYLESFNDKETSPPPTAKDAAQANRELEEAESEYRIVPNGYGGWVTARAEDLADNYGEDWAVEENPLTGQPDVGDEEYFRDLENKSGDKDVRGYLHAFNTDGGTDEEAEQANKELAEDGSEYRIEWNGEDYGGFWVAVEAPEEDEEE